ncbi:MAG: pentapeptide repeat-containing protein [Candidatus Omnitrophota bacterium]
MSPDAKIESKNNILAAARTEKGLAGCDLKKADLSQADLSGAHMFDACLEGASLVGVNLAGCDLTHCNMANADLTKANLTGARLWNADLSGANLTECDLTGADLWNAKLFNVKLWQANFERAKSISRRSFSSQAGLLDSVKINETGSAQAEDSYRNLKAYFMARGMYNDAGWASFKEKVMERFSLKKSGNLKYFPSLAMSALCGYGEKPFRIIFASLFTIILFALFFYSHNAIEYTGIRESPLRWGDYLYYSTITFTTVGYGDIVPKPQTLFRLMAAFEAFMGVFLTGLFIFTLARKYSAR